MKVKSLSDYLLPWLHPSSDLFLIEGRNPLQIFEFAIVVLTLFRVRGPDLILAPAI